MSNRRGNILLIVLAVAGILAASVGGYFWWQRVNNITYSHQDQLIDPGTISSKAPPAWQVTLPNISTESARWKLYEDKLNQFNFKYPSTKFVLKPDGLNELKKREPNNTLLQALGKSPPKVIKALRFDDGNYSGETYFTPFALWIFDNPEKLTPDEWWEKYSYFPFLISSPRTEIGTITVDNEPATYSYNYLGSQWYDFYIAKRDKIFLFHFENYLERPILGLQILSTFRFSDLNSTQNWKTYVNNMVPNFKYQISYPQSWFLEDQPFSYSNEPVSGDFLTLTKDGYKIHDNRVPHGGSACEFPDSLLPQDLKPFGSYYNNFVELTLGSAKARRVKEKEIEQDKPDQYSLCSRAKDGFWQKATDFGPIWYETPKGETKYLNEMEQIVQTLKKI